MFNIRNTYILGWDTKLQPEPASYWLGYFAAAIEISLLKTELKSLDRVEIELP